jgi:multiple sugar transport system substrate-binding protein
MQWACSKDIMVRCTLGGGFAPMRLSSFADKRVKAKEVVGPGTTRHLPVVLDIINKDMASEPDMPLWAGFSNNEIPVNLGKLLTGQDFGGSAKKCMDTIASLIDAQVKEAGL